MELLATTRHDARALRRARLLGDGERLNPYGDVAKLARHNVHVLLVVDDELGHDAVSFLDAALRTGTSHSMSCSSRLWGRTAMAFMSTAMPERRKGFASAWWQFDRRRAQP